MTGDMQDPLTEWMNWGRCRGEKPAMFFPPDGAGVMLAQEVCAVCTVRRLCLEYALENRIEHGVWGGASERERARIARARRAARRAAGEKVRGGGRKRGSGDKVRVRATGGAER